MNNTIILSYDSFDAYSTAIIYKDNKESDRIAVKTNVKDMAHQITEYARHNNIYDVRFHGPSLIRNEFESNVKEIEKNLYSENKITVKEI